MRHATQKLGFLLLPVLLIISAVIPVSLPVVTGTASASVTCNDGSTKANVSLCTHTCPDGPAVQQDEDCAVSGGNCSEASQANDTQPLAKCDLVVKFIKPLVDFLGALVGVAVIFSIVVGGIQYSSSSGDPAKVSAAKLRIRNAVIALVVFIFLYALLGFLLPGGLSSSAYLL